MKTKIAKLLPALILGLGFSYSGLSFNVRGDSHLSEVLENITKPKPAFAQQQLCSVSAEQVRQYLSNAMFRARVRLSGFGAGEYTGREQLEQALSEVKQVWMYPPCYNLRASIEEPFERAWRFHSQNLYQSDMARITNQYELCMVSAGFRNQANAESRCKRTRESSEFTANERDSARESEINAFFRRRR